MGLNPRRPTEDTTRRKLASRLHDLAADIAAAAQTSPPAPIQLAHAYRGFVVAGAVSSLLDQHTVPRHENYAVCNDYCNHTVQQLAEVLGTHLLRRYATGAQREDLSELFRDGQEELHVAALDDIEQIAAAMVTLSATLRDLATPIADDEDLPTIIRSAAYRSADSAEILWSHYGEDSGGL
jgi:hypothetical protein